MERYLSRLKAFVDHPLTHLVVGLALISTGAMDIYGDVINESQRFRIGTHHGIVIIGIVQALSALPDVVVGIERWLRAAEIVEAKKEKE